MSSEFDDFMVHGIVAEGYLGHGSLGAQYAPPTLVACLLEEQDHLVINSEGQEVTATSTAYVTDLTKRDALVPRSRITLTGQRTAVVETRSIRTSGPLDLPDHIEVHLR